MLFEFQKKIYNGGTHATVSLLFLRTEPKISSLVASSFQSMF